MHHRLIGFAPAGLLISICMAPVIAASLAGCTSTPRAAATGQPSEAAHITNHIGMTLIRIPAGAFLMGSDEPAAALAKAYPDYDPARFGLLGDEAPVHRVEITRSFYMGQTEVTVAQFRRFIEASGHVPESVADGTGGYGYSAAHVAHRQARQDAFEGRATHYSWRNPGFVQTDDDPVVNVTWHDAVAMAQWLSRIEGRTYRLPTEAEWEYACKAGGHTRYQHGDDPNRLGEVANVFDASAAPHWPEWQRFAIPMSDGYAFTAPVARYPANAFGLHDMHGNVWEWTADWHDDAYYAQSPQRDPQGPTTGTVRVRRGGSWHTWPFYARCAYRNWNAPTTRYTLVGFRLVMDAAPRQP